MVKAFLTVLQTDADGIEMDSVASDHILNNRDWMVNVKKAVAKYTQLNLVTKIFWCSMAIKG